MSERNNHLGKALDAAAMRAEYDEHVKRLLADKQILAWIMKNTVEEFEDMTIQDIIPCIEPPEIGTVSVDPYNGEIIGQPNESNIPYEGKMYYDIRFNAKAPERRSTEIHLMFDIEAQKDPNPGYDLVTRSIVYCSRMISEQYSRVFTGKDYDKVQKVYSIWVVMNCGRDSANTISAYKLQHVPLHGEYKDDSRYDLVNSVFIRLPKDGAADKAINKPEAIHKMLSTLFTDELPPGDKKRILKEEYDINTTIPMEGEMQSMCNLSEAIYERGIERGMAQGMAQGLEQGIAQGIEQGMAQGMEQGREQYSRQMAKLGQFLLKEGRMDELSAILNNPSKIEELIQKYGL